MTPEAFARVAPELAARIVADSRDRVGWMRARSRGITATDVAQLTSHTAIARAADAKLGAGAASPATPTPTTAAAASRRSPRGWRRPMASSPRRPSSTPSSRSVTSRPPTASRWMPRAA
jgi:hypothetical protein